MARNMKVQTRELLARGYSGEQVLTYFEKAYGEFVRLEPPKRGVNWLVWLSPVVFLVVGFFFVRAMIAKMSAQRAAVEQSAVDEDKAIDDVAYRNRLPEDDELARYVLMARELAYGWSGGVSPESEEEGQ
jgi:cytochrome c-type biogenesis protein CcmH/NrfF